MSSQIHTRRVQWRWPGLGVEATGSWGQLQLEKMRRFWRGMVEMVVQTLKHGSMVDFMLCILPQLKKS